MLGISQLGTEHEDSATSVISDGRGATIVGGTTLGLLAGTDGGGQDIWFGRFGCYADCDQSTGIGTLDIYDFLCFSEDFAAGNLYACDCDQATGFGVCDVLDFLCFGNSFYAGCP
jgi:hypothetical protein